MRYSEGYSLRGYCLGYSEGTLWVLSGGTLRGYCLGYSGGTVWGTLRGYSPRVLFEGTAWGTLGYCLGYSLRGVLQGGKSWYSLVPYRVLLWSPHAISGYSTDGGYSEYSPDAADDRERQRDDRAETADGRDAQNRLERDRAARAGCVCTPTHTHAHTHTHPTTHTRTDTHERTTGERAHVAFAFGPNRHNALGCCYSWHRHRSYRYNALDCCYS